ncbi:MAG: primosomal protein N' (replication factor Y) [Cellvibrionaceae bacterium]|jgi:primosomal protein N' (replication factor Y)
MTESPYLYSVVVPAPLRRSFIYSSTHVNIPVGTRVSVPFGRQKAIVGIVVGAAEKYDIPSKKLRSIHAVLETQPSLSPEILKLCQWCADYYHYPLGEVCHMALPALLRKPQAVPNCGELVWRLTSAGEQTDLTTLNRARRQQAALEHFHTGQLMDAATRSKWDISADTLRKLNTKGLIEKIERPSDNAAHQLPQEILKTRPLKLNSEQQQALDNIDTERFVCHLIEGVTGSGKTEIYLQVMEQVLRRGQQVLVLVPEIGLTPQTLARFEARFQLPVAVLHSGLNDKQRFELWQQSLNHQLRIVIGTRSSVFTPMGKLGLIIIDEEHDPSYRQQDSVRYSARDLAIIRAQQCDIPLLLGSATPSLESLHNALSKRYRHLQLHERVNQQALPQIHCIAAQDQYLSDESRQAMATALDQGQQILVFINRRGYAPTLTCPDCGWICQCPHCDNRMTLHRVTGSSSSHSPQTYLHCHRCDRREPLSRHCPDCRSANLQALGSGTQRSEETLSNLFPDAKILRIDRDSIARKGQWQAVLKEIHSEKPCILVGTQMLAKGHHFRNLGLAVILGLDSAFFSSDFRGSERMGQLLTQVVGRVGRDRWQGKVLIQTGFGDHPTLRELIDQGYHHLAQSLLAERRITAMPPWQHLALIRCHGPRADAVYGFLQEARLLAEGLHPANADIVQYLGPFPATPEKRNNRFHVILQIKTTKRQLRKRLLHQLCIQLEQKKLTGGLQWLVDVDPQEF